MDPAMAARGRSLRALFGCRRSWICSRQRRVCMRSSVEIYNVKTGEARVIWQTERLVEAPNYAPDGSYLLLNDEGLLYRLALDGSAKVEHVDTGFATACNNDHGISPDGTRIVISDKVEFGKSAIYTLPIEGGAPQLVTTNHPSYWHGWSP